MKMGIETILFSAAAIGAQAAVAPTSAIIRPGSGDAFIVGVVGFGPTISSTTITAAQDSRWDAAGFIVNGSGNGGVQDASAFEYGILPKKVPIKRGVTLACAVAGGAGRNCVLVYVDYPDIGEAYAPRNLYGAPGAGQLTTRNATAGAVTVANTIMVNSVAVVNFSEGRTYRLMSVNTNLAITGTVFAVGFTDPHTNLMTFWALPISNLLESGTQNNVLPEGALTPLKRGETLQVHFYQTAAAETPQANLLFAHDAGT
jgi:hypothetical protein